MIVVKSVTIKRFRSFLPGECFDLGRGVTLIAGLNVRQNQHCWA